MKFDDRYPDANYTDVIDLHQHEFLRRVNDHEPCHTCGCDTTWRLGGAGRPRLIPVCSDECLDAFKLAGWS